MASSMSGTASSNSSLYHDYYSDDYSSEYDSDSSMASTNSTPNKQGAAGVRHRTRDNMDAALQKDLLGRTLRDVSIQDFLKQVYGFDDEDVKYINALNVRTLHSGGLAEYDTALRNGLQEQALYLPFKTIIDDLFQKFNKDGYKTDIDLASLGDEQLKSTGTPRKPDGLFFFKSHNKAVSWSLSKAFLEFEITSSGRRLRNAARGRIGTICEGTMSTQSAPEMGVAGHVGVTVSAPDLAPSPMITTPSGSKRPSSDVLAVEEQGPSKRLRPNTRKESQAAGYALEMMASGCRRWATGLVIRDKNIWVHYYDRIGAIFTQKFNFFEEPWKLAMLALALAKCDVIQAGFEPLISRSLDSPLSAPLPSLEDTVLRLPPCDDSGATFVKDIGKGEWSHFVITGVPLYAYPGLNGRGSHVLPGRLVKAVKEKGTQTEKVTVDASEGPAKKPDFPVTRNMTAGAKDSDDSGNVGKTTKSGEALLQVTMAAKLSWPLATRPSLEAEVVHLLRERIPWMKYYLPQVHFAMVLRGTSVKLPGDLFRSMTMAQNLEQRYFTLMVVDQYKHLWEVPTYDDFIAVYLDIVECHHAAMKFGKVLHRDISDKNLLWRWRSRCAGILNDWDLSSVIAPQGAHAKHRTGTGPFMALDLLTDDPEPPTHLYRHDLESLFYVLVWAAVHYTLDKEKPFASKSNAAILKWAGTYDDALHAKRSFLDDPVPVFKGIQPAFEPLRKHLNALRNLFHKAHQNSVTLATRLQSRSKTNVASTIRRARKRNVDLVMGSDDEELPSIESNPHPEPSVPVDPLSADEVDIDFETMGGCLTFENFLAALGEQPRPVLPKYQPLLVE